MRNLHRYIATSLHRYIATSLVLALVLSLVSCEKDDAFETVNSTESQINNHGSYKLETGSFSSLDDKKLARGLLSLNQQLTSSKGEPFSIEIDTSYYNLLIDRDTNKKHYTFALETQKGEAFKNIIFTTKTDGTYKTTLAEYNVGQTQLMGIVRGDRSVLIPESDRVFTTILVSEDFQTAERCDGICLDIEAIWVEGSSCRDGIHDYGQPGCFWIGTSGEATAGYWIFQQNDCGSCGASGDGPGGDIPDTNNGNGNTGEYGSGGSGSTDNDDVATTPTISLERQRRLNFLAELNEEERNCFQNNLSETQTEAIYNFLESTDGPTDIIGLFYVPEKVAFAKAAITAQCENNNAEVDDENRIIERFEGTKADCVHDNLKAIDQENPNITLYHKLLNNFNDATENWLYFEVGETGDDWAQTSGNALNNNNTAFPDVYKIMISNNLNQNGSNLAIMTTLAHELVHAYMFDTLSDAGVITFEENTGVPKLNVTCQDGTSYDNFNLNTLSTSERFSALICAMNASNTLSPQWSHDLFNENVFSVTTYQQQLADYIFENHDWGNESFDFINEAQNIFGSGWKLQVSEAASWIGLEVTDEYFNYINQINDPVEQQYILDFRNKINDAKNNCQ